MPFLSFINPIFAWNVPLVSLIFLKRSQVFPILLFSSISLHCSLRKAFLSFLAILWNSAYRCLYLSLESINTNKAIEGDGITAELFQILKGDAVKMLHSICQQIRKTQQWPWDWKMSVFIPIPKKGNAKECSYYWAIALFSHTSQVILQDQFHQYGNWELPDVQLQFRKGRGTRVQTANTIWIIEKSREFQKKIYFCFIDYAKAFDSVDHNKLWKILKEMWIPDHLTCLLRNLNASQKAAIRTGHGTIDWFKIEKWVCQGCILSPFLFNFYAEYIMWNAWLDEAQVGIKFSEKNISNFRYADDITIITESKEEIKSLMMKVKEESEKLASNSIFKK